MIRYGYLLFLKTFVFFVVNDKENIKNISFDYFLLPFFVLENTKKKTLTLKKKNSV